MSGRGIKRLAVSALFLLAGCSGTGIPFNSAGLQTLQPGVTTLAEVSKGLGAQPEAIYRDSAGAFMARWAYGTTMITDVAYTRRELWLAFDAAGRYQRVVKAMNVSRPRELPAPSGSGDVKSLSL